MTAADRTTADVALLEELMQWAVALRDPVALAYDGATTRTMIVKRLQDHHDATRIAPL